MKRQYIFTERAHLMCPGMCFGIAAVLAAPCDKSRLRHTLSAVSYAHPFLNATIGYEEQTDRYFYDVGDKPTSQLTVFDGQLDSLCDKRITEQFEKAASQDIDLRKEGMLRVYAWHMQDSACVLFVFHHLLADGRGALGLVREFSDMYVSGKAPVFVEENLIASAGDLPLGAEFSGLSRTFVNMYNKKWLREGSHISYEHYHQFAQHYMQNHPVSHSTEVTDNEKLSALLEKCHEQGVTLNDFLLAQMFEKHHPGSVVIASDLRSKLLCYKAGALGNYSSAFTVKLKMRGRSLWRAARSLHTEVRNTVSDISKLCLVLSLYCIMEPALIDAAAPAALGGFDSKAAASAGKTILGYSKSSGHCITNLGRLESSTMREAMFIPPASPAMKITQGILTVNGRMYTCTAGR